MSKPRSFFGVFTEIAGGALCKCERSCKAEGRSQRNCFRSHGRFLFVVVQEKVPLRHQVPPAFSAIEAAKLFSFSKAKNASATVFHRNPTELGGRAEFGSLGFC